MERPESCSPSYILQRQLQRQELSGFIGLISSPGASDKTSDLIANVKPMRLQYCRDANR